MQARCHQCLVICWAHRLMRCMQLLRQRARLPHGAAGTRQAAHAHLHLQQGLVQQLLSGSRGQPGLARLHCLLNKSSAQQTLLHACRLTQTGQEMSKSSAGRLMRSLHHHTATLRAAMHSSTSSKGGVLSSLRLSWSSDSHGSSAGCISLTYKVRSSSALQLLLLGAWLAADRTCLAPELPCQLQLPGCLSLVAWLLCCRMLLQVQQQLRNHHWQGLALHHHATTVRQNTGRRLLSQRQ